MKRIAFLLYALALMISAKAQTLNVNVGQVTYSYKSSQTGDMTYDGGNTLTILGKTYNTADIADITIDNTTVGDSTINVVYAGNEAKVNVSGDIANMITAEVNGANVKIVQDVALLRTVNYTLSGNSDNGSFYMDGNFKTNITLNNLTLSNPTDSLIYIDCGKKIYIILEGTNTLADGIGGTHNACLYSDGHTEIKGSGTLNITARTKHAFTSDERCVISGGTINVLAAPGDGMHLNERFTMTAGTINIKSVGDGIDVGFRGVNKGTKDQYAYNGWAEISGGSITLNVTGDSSKGLKADSTIVVSNTANINISMSGTCTYDAIAKDVSGTAAIKPGGAYQQTGGTVYLQHTGAGGRGINASEDVTFSGGTATIVTFGKVYEYGALEKKSHAVKSDKNIYFNGGDIRIAAAPDDAKPWDAGTNCYGYINGGTLMTIASKKVTPGTGSKQGYKNFSNISITAGQTFTLDGLTFNIPSIYKITKAAIITSKP